MVCVLLGVVLGALWYLLAPSGSVVARPGVLLSVDDPELAAGQDGVFALLSVAAGLAVGAWVSFHRAGASASRAVSAVVGSALGSLLAWQVGGWFGPDDVPTGPQTGGGPAVPAPLDVHALGLLATWPALTASTIFAVLLFRSLAGRDR